MPQLRTHRGGPWAAAGPGLGPPRTPLQGSSLISFLTPHSLSDEPARSQTLLPWTGTRLMPQFRRSCASRRSNKAAAPKTRPGSLSRRHQHGHPHSAPAAGARSQGRTHQVPDAEDDGAGADMAAEAAAVGVETCPGRAQHLGGSSGLCRSAPLSGLIRGAGPDWGRPLGGRDRQHGPGGWGELCGSCGHLYP